MRTFSMLFALLLVRSIGLAQEADQFGKNIAQVYPTGNKAFLLEIYNNVRYPEDARINCRVGVLKTLVAIDTSGNVESVILGNRLGMGIEQEVIRVLMLTSGKWKKGRSFKFPINFGFRIGKSQDEFSGDINITAFAAGPTAHSGCSIPKKELEKQIARFTKKGKSEKAQPLYEELLRRYPDDQGYQQALKEIVKEN